MLCLPIILPLGLDRWPPEYDPYYGGNDGQCNHDAQNPVANSMHVCPSHELLSGNEITTAGKLFHAQGFGGEKWWAMLDSNQ